MVSFINILRNSERKLGSNSGTPDGTFEPN